MLRYNTYKFNRKRDTEHPRGKSLVVPDDSYTLKEILQKFTHGVDPSINKLGYFDDEPDHDDDDLDAMDREDYGDKIDRMRDAQAFQQDFAEKLKKQRQDKEKGTKEKPEQKSGKNPDSDSKTDKS